MNKIQVDTKSFIETQCRIAGCAREAEALSKGYSVIVEGRFDNSGADDDNADEISDLGNGYNSLCEADNNQSCNKVDEWELMPKVLFYLIAHDYYIVGWSGNRNISSDGWYELGYYLRNKNDPNFTLYLDTHYDHDQDFEDEWESRDGDEVQPEDIIWDHIDDYWRGFEHILEDDTVRNLLPPEMVSQMQYCLAHKSN